eukprot:SAG11_NODE_3110_length_2680_cov_1.724138_4_plen_324_part_00
MYKPNVSPRLNVSSVNYMRTYSSGRPSVGSLYRDPAWFHNIADGAASTRAASLAPPPASPGRAPPAAEYASQSAASEEARYATASRLAELEQHHSERQARAADAPSMGDAASITAGLTTSWRQLNPTQAGGVLDGQGRSRSSKLAGPLIDLQGFKMHVSNVIQHVLSSPDVQARGSVASSAARLLQEAATALQNAAAELAPDKNAPPMMTQPPPGRSSAAYLESMLATPIRPRPIKQQLTAATVPQTQTSAPERAGSPTSAPRLDPRPDPGPRLHTTASWALPGPAASMRAHSAACDAIGETGGGHCTGTGSGTVSCTFGARR